MTDLNSEARALLDIARDGDGATDADRDRIRRGLAATLGAGAFATTSATAAAKAGVSAAGAVATTTAFTGAKFVAWVAVGVVAGLGGVAAISSLAEPPPARAPVIVPTAVAHVPVSRAPEQGAAPASNVSTAAVGNDNANPPATSPVEVGQPRAQEGRTARRDEGQDTSSLLAETRLIEHAQAALARGKPADALRAVDDHRQQYPNGALVPERLAVQAVALCKLGDRDGARRSATELNRIAPASPLWPRVQQACDFDRTLP